MTEAREVMVLTIRKTRPSTPNIDGLTDAIIAALSAAGKVIEDDWQTIETAPKDGTHIILGYFLEHGGGGGPSIAFWHSIKKLWCGNEGFLNAEGYFSPTHWRPLPNPPATPPGSGGGG